MILHDIVPYSNTITEAEDFKVSSYRSTFGLIGPNGEEILPKTERDEHHQDLVDNYIKYRLHLLDAKRQGWISWYIQKLYKSDRYYIHFHTKKTLNQTQFVKIARLCKDLSSQFDVAEYSLEGRDLNNEFTEIEAKDFLKFKNQLMNVVAQEPVKEGWKPKNKAKHKSCQQSVKNRVSVWPSAYASAQVVQCYYGKRKRKKK